MKLIRLLLPPAGLLLLLAGALFALACVSEIMDPVGSKMADDAAPFGRPASPTASAFGIFIGLTVSAGGYALILRSLATPFPSLTAS